jgi:hypothetical protein
MTFFAVVNMGVAVLSAFFYLILYVCTFNTDLLFSVHIHGLAGYIAGVSVAVKQIMPDHMLVKTPLGKLTNRNIPLSVFFMSLIFWLIGLLEGTYPTMFLSGLLISWNYLRFYQYHSNGTRGDMADNFTFARCDIFYVFCTCFSLTACYYSSVYCWCNIYFRFTILVLVYEFNCR